MSSGNFRVAELVIRITDRYQLKIVQVYAPTTSHSDEETGNLYNTIDKILEKQTHYTIVMGDFNAKVGGQTNTSERATGCFGLGQRNEITCCNLVLFKLLYYNVINLFESSCNLLTITVALLFFYAVYLLGFHL